MQQMPVIIAGNDAQKKKYLGRMTEEPLMCVSLSDHFLVSIYNVLERLSKPSLYTCVDDNQACVDRHIV